MRTKLLFWGIFSVFVILSAWFRIGIPHDDLIRGDMVRYPSIVDIGLLNFMFPTLTMYAFWELGGLVGTVGSSQASLGHTISEVQPLFAPYGDFTMSLI